MKTAHLMLFVLSTLLLAACSAGQTASDRPVKPATAANSNQEASAGDANSAKAPAEAKPNEPAKLIGTYEAREVHDKGVVTLLSNLKTVWMFSEDGKYQRLSLVKGKPYHADSGMFRIDPPDKLVLTIQLTGMKANRKIQNPPLMKTHIFSLSADGEELRMTSEKGSVAIFARIAKPKVQ